VLAKAVIKIISTKRHDHCKEGSLRCWRRESSKEMSASVPALRRIKVLQRGLRSKSVKAARERTAPTACAPPKPNPMPMMPLVIKKSTGVRGRVGKIFWVTIAVKARSNSAIALAGIRRLSERMTQDNNEHLIILKVRNHHPKLLLRNKRGLAF